MGPVAEVDLGEQVGRGKTGENREFPRRDTRRKGTEIA